MNRYACTQRVSMPPVRPLLVAGPRPTSRNNISSRYPAIPRNRTRNPLRVRELCERPTALLLVWSNSDASECTVHMSYLHLGMCTATERVVHTCRAVTGKSSVLDCSSRNVVYLIS